MAQADWNVPRTEEGLQQVLRRLEECRANGDQVEVGNGLLKLSYLVKWVRSDTAASPCARAHELALQALEVFRGAGDREGLVRALVAASAMADFRERERLLSEAEALAEGIGDENSVAMVLAAKARALGLSDRGQATELHRRALAIFKRTENQRGQAQCLFSLSIREGTSYEKYDFAIEGARLYAGLGDHAEASRCIMMALVNAEEIRPLSELGDLAQEGLQYALNAGDRTQEGSFYRKLALIADANEQQEEADKYRRWATDIEESDGRTPHERWEDNLDMAKMMIAMAKTQGHKDAAKAFREELKRLKASEPAS